MSKTTKAGELAKQMLTEYPTAGSLTLAKRLHQQFPEHFISVEQARSTLRTLRGVNGEEHRRKLSDITHAKDLQAVLEAKFNLPEPAVMQREPYHIPKANNKIIVFGDAHFPYQNNRGIYAALNYGAKKGANCFLLNGDMIDLYQISRFTKDGRKPNVEYDIELFYQFLVDLRASFPNALIIWKFGNHEERWDTYLKNNAPLLYMTGTNALDDTMPLGDLNIQVIKDKRRIICADLNILHGHEYGSGAGQVNPARAISLKSHSNMLVNHFHRSSQHKVSNFGKVTHYNSLGAMCVAQDYNPYGQQDCSFGWLQVEDGVCWVQNREVV